MMTQKEMENTNDGTEQNLITMQLTHPIHMYKSFHQENGESSLQYYTFHISASALDRNEEMIRQAK
jgi:hypothetical protein